MDIACSCCGELWDAYHLRYDLIPSVYQLVGPLDGSTPNDLSKNLRAALNRSGWVFGKTVFNVKKCSCCEINGCATSPPVSDPVKEALEQVLAFDLDALQSEIEDLCD